MDKDIRLCLVALIICHIIVYCLADLKCKPESPQALRNAEADRLEAFTKFQLVPDVLDTSPQSVLDLVYSPGVAGNLGNELKAADLVQAPHVTWIADGNKFYSLLAVDPDAPSRTNPINKEYLHWFVGNIQGGNIARGEVFSAYHPPTPPRGSGLHRYVFMILEQPGKITFNEPHFAANEPAPHATGPTRSHFNTRSFMQKYKLGPVVAGNFFQAQNT